MFRHDGGRLMHKTQNADIETIIVDFNQWLESESLTNVVLSASGVTATETNAVGKVTLTLSNATDSGTLDIIGVTDSGRKRTVRMGFDVTDAPLRDYRD